MLQKHFGWLYGSSLRQQHQGGHDRTNYKDGIWWWRSLLLVKSSAAALFVVFFSTFFLCSVFFATRGPDFSLLSAILGASKGNPLKSEIPVLILPPKPLPKSNPLQPENPVHTLPPKPLPKSNPLQPENPVHTVPPKPLPKGNPLQQPENPALPLTPKLHPKIEYPLRCNPPQSNTTQTCPTDYYPTKPDLDPNAPPPPACPDYFRWIHEDLKPWKENGITRETLERARRTANFRLVIKNGKAYMQRFQKSFQSRDVFTLWGIVQLLRRYPGQIPDLELMFDCVDWPVILAHHYRTSNVTAPPLFRYCRDSKTLDLVFPDWSFWGWPEINIKPWNTLSKELKEGSKRKSWMEREPYAYWKGNPTVADTRMDLLKCNVSDQQDWHARIYAQDWIKESQQGYKQSDLASQCIHRYKIYIEGSAWSVSEKYILACDSVTLVVKPRYFDFFSRSLMPVEHYWPVKEDDKCKSIKFAVEWGDNHKQKAQAIGRAASKFVHEDLKMDYVYDYMLHMLTEYAKLLKFDPEIPQDAVELCAETMACHMEGLERKFMTESMVMGPADKVPCMMPPPYDRAGLFGLLRRKSNSVSQVEKWERDYWEARTNITDKQSR